MKCGTDWGITDTGKGRSPCGERGLKSLPRGCARARAASLPVRGAWVEIGRAECKAGTKS